MKNGFTLVELLIVIGIIVILAAATIPIYGNLQISSQLNDNNLLIIQALRSAKERSVVGYNNSSHGVKFFSNQFVLYQGSSYAARNSSYDSVTELAPVLFLSTTLNNDEINFSKGLGVPDNVGTTTLAHSSGGERTVSVNSLGKVEE